MVKNFIILYPSRLIYISYLHIYIILFINNLYITILNNSLRGQLRLKLKSNSGYVFCVKPYNFCVQIQQAEQFYVSYEIHS